MFSQHHHQLLNALQAGRFDVVLQLLESHPELVEFKDDKGHTILMYAAFKGTKQLVNLLLGKGVDVREKDMDGLNAYDWAVLGSNFESGTIIMKAMIK